MNIGLALQKLLLALSVILLCADPGLATDVQVWGGAGGNYFRAPCPEGSYLVGLAGRTGEWIDRIAPVCARWLRHSQSFGASSVGPSFGGEGGKEVTPPVVCQGPGADTSAVSSWTIETLRSANRLVQYVGATCTSLSPSPSRYWSAFLEFGPRPALEEERVSPGPVKTGRGRDQSCPSSEIATGFHGRAGLFVDALGLICGPLPLGPGAPVARLPNPMIQAPPSGNLQTKRVDTALITPPPTILQPKTEPPPAVYVEKRPIAIRIAPPQNWNNVVSYMVQLQRKDGKGNWYLHTNLPVTAASAHGAGNTDFGAGTGLLSSAPGAWRLNAQVLYPTKSALSNWVEFTVTQGPVAPAPSSRTKGLMVR